MSGASEARNVSSEIVSPTPRFSSDEMATVKKKSILLSPEYKRGSSKVTIHWEESVKHGQRWEERMKLDKRSKLHALGHLMSHGSKWSYVQEFMTRLKAEEGKIFKSTRSLSEEDSQGRRVSSRRIDSLSVVRELWHGMLQKTAVKEVDLTLDQQTKLKLLKHKIKLENDKYLKGHPELDILLSLVYRKLLRTKPDDPKLFVANYVHYLNTHREELVLDEIDVPFDRAPVKVEEPDEDMFDEKQEIEVFVRELVEKCAEMASGGSAVANVTSIIDSILDKIDSVNDEDSISSHRSAEETVRGVLTSMLTSVVRARTRSAEIVAEEVLDTVFENVCPSVRRDSEEYFEMRESVEGFVKNLLKNVTDKAVRQAKRQARLTKYDKSISGEESTASEDLDVLSNASKSILKKLIPHQEVWENNNHKPEFKSKVKFQSVSIPGAPLTESPPNENLND